MSARLDAWRSVGIVVAFLSAWIAFAAGWPEQATPIALRVSPLVEPPIEVPELGVLLGCLAAWVAIALRTRGRGRPFGVAVAMIAQLVLIVGEELDWGQGREAPIWLGARNLRMVVRSAGLLSPVLDPLAFVPVLVLFLLAPIVPLAAVRGWLARAEPSRAYVPDAVACIVGVLGFAAGHLALGRAVPFDILETTVYLVLASATVRALHGSRRSALVTNGEGDA